MEIIVGLLSAFLIGIPLGIIAGTALTYFIVKRNVINKVEAILLERIGSSALGKIDAAGLQNIIKDALAKKK